MTEKHENLAAALAAVQAEMPKIGKGNRADAGTYSYSYADLADIVAVAGPVMGKHGLSFSSKPTLNEDGKFVLEYRLRHAAGQEDVGQYPLPTSGTPQQMGSAQSYARRYCLLAVLNLAPDDDDDGKAAAGATHDYSGPARQRQRTAETAPEQQVTKTPVDVARGELAAKVEKDGLDMVAVRKCFAARYEYPLREAKEADVVRAFTKLLPGILEVQPEPATNGAAQ
jgi:hypothetical protein